jgi:hypothetical protein
MCSHAIRLLPIISSTPFKFHIFGTHWQRKRISVIAELLDSYAAEVVA